jgi:hypothetical protein
MTKARKQLKIKILRKSVNRTNFDVAKTEWLGIDFRFDTSATSKCECTK